MSTSKKQEEVTICAPLYVWQALHCLSRIVSSEMQQQYFANPADTFRPGTFRHSFDVVDTYLFGLLLDGILEGDNS